MNRLLLSVGLAVVVSAAHAQVFYNGDFSNDAYLAGSYDDVFVYADARVASPHISKIWGNFIIYESQVSLVTALNFEVRRGMSPGNGGTLVASGIVSNFTKTYTGRTWQNGFYKEVQLSGTVDITLPRGTYSLGLMAQVQGATTVFLSETLGADLGPSADPNPSPQHSLLDQNSYASEDANGNPFTRIGRDFSIGLVTGPKIVHR